MAASSYHQLNAYPPTAPSATDQETAYSSPSPKPYTKAPLTNPPIHETEAHQPLKPPQRIATTIPANRLQRRKYEKWKRYLRILRTLTKACTTLFSTTMFAAMIYMTVKYNTTKTVIREDRNPWPKAGTKLWPTIMLLVGSGVTLLLSLATLVSYCANWDRARRSWKVTALKYAVHILGWVVISAVYRYEKGLNGNENDLWGWSCSQEVGTVQGLFEGVVDFRVLCNIQVSQRLFVPFFLSPFFTGRRSTTSF